MILSYHDNETTKAEHVMLAMFHRESNRLRAGTYGDAVAGTGCSVGCLAMDRGLRSDDHAGLAAAVGLPEWLVRLQDSVFEGLPDFAKADWHVALAEAVPVGLDLQPAYHRICARILREVAWPASKPDDEWGCAQAVRLVASLHEAPASSTESAWSSAEAAAWSAVSAAAWSAARAASEEAAAWSAEWSAESAAWSVAESAAWSVESAARSAESAAASAARSAARSAAWVQIAAIVLAEVAR